MYLFKIYLQFILFLLFELIYYKFHYLKNIFYGTLNYRNLYKYPNFKKKYFFLVPCNFSFIFLHNFNLQRCKYVYIYSIYLDVKVVNLFWVLNYFYYAPLFSLHYVLYVILLTNYIYKKIYKIGEFVKERLLCARKRYIVTNFPVKFKKQNLRVYACNQLKGLGKSVIDTWNSFLWELNSTCSFSVVDDLYCLIVGCKP